PAAFSCISASSWDQTAERGDVLSESLGLAWHTAVARLDSSKALACHQDASGSLRARCAVVVASATTLRQGALADVTAGEVQAIVLEQISTDMVFACFRHAGAGASCRVIQVMGLDLVQGISVTVSADLTYHLSLAYLSDNRSVLCYQSNIVACKCRVIHAAGIVISLGTELTLPGTAAALVVAPLTADQAVACISDSAKMRYATCYVLEASGLTGLARVGSTGLKVGLGEVAYLAAA
ncbi:unnamed protein product, partial [Polarella glacialis]